MTSILPQLERELERRVEAEVLLDQATAGGQSGTSNLRRDRTPRRRLHLGLAATAAIAVAAFALLALPVGDRARLDIVQEARAALDPGRAIVHTVTTRRTGPLPASSSVVLDDGTRVRDEFNESRTEHWGTTRPLRYRDVVANRLAGRLLATQEEAYDDRRFSQVRGDEVRTAKVPQAMFESITELRTLMGAFSATGPFTEDPVDDLRTLLADGKIRPDGEQRLDGRRVLRLVPADPAADRRAAEARRSEVGMTTPVEYLVDAKTYAPVRVTYRFPSSTVAADPQPELTSVITFETYERLEPNPENERLLTIDPAGRTVVEDPDMFTGRKVPMKRRR